MVNLKVLRQQKADLKAEERKLRAEAAKITAAARDGKRALTDDEKTRVEELKVKIADNAAAQESNAFEIENAEALARLEDPSQDQPVVEDLRTAAIADPMKGFKTAKQFFGAVVDAQRLGPASMDKRLRILVPRKGVQAAAGSDEQSGFDAPHGQFLIPSGIVPGVMEVSPETDPIGARIRSVPMENPTVKMRARVDKNHSTSVTGGLRVYRRGEAGTVTASRLEWEEIDLTAHPMMGLTYETEELLRDAPAALASIMASFPQEFSAKRVDEILNGTGVGEYEGLMSSPALVTVTKETGQAADTIVYENCIKMLARCWGNRAGMVWLANHDCLPTLAQMAHVIGVSGTPVFVPNTVPATLFGIPIVFTEYTKTVGDLGDIVLVNFQEYLEGIYQPLESAESMHVRFVEHERVFKFYMRCDGAGWWRTALTPKRSSATLSPFVALAARS